MKQLNPLLHRFSPFVLTLCKRVLHCSVVVQILTMVFWKTVFPSANVSISTLLICEMSCVGLERERKFSSLQRKMSEFHQTCRLSDAWALRKDFLKLRQAKHSTKIRWTSQCTMRFLLSILFMIPKVRGDWVQIWGHGISKCAASSRASVSSKDKAETLNHHLGVFKRHTRQQLSRKQKKADLDNCTLWTGAGSRRSWAPGAQFWEGLPHFFFVIIGKCEINWMTLINFIDESIYVLCISLKSSNLFKKCFDIVFNLNFLLICCIMYVRATRKLCVGEIKT